MYELTCPSCQHKVRLAFLRVGAMVACRQCAHRYQVQAEHIRRRVTVPADTGVDADNPLLLGYPVERPPAPQRPARPKGRKSKEAAGDDGGIPISELVGQPKAELFLRPIQPVLKYEEPSEDVARVIARNRAQRGRGRQVLWFAVIGAALLVALVIFLVAGGGTDPGAGEVSSGSKSPAGGTRPGGGARAPLPRVAAEPLATSVWKQVDETIRRGMPASSVSLVNDKIAPGLSGRSVYLADLKVEAAGVIESADLHLMLLGADGRVFARNKVPLMLLAADATEGAGRHPVAVPIPQKMAERTSKVVSWVKVEKEMVDGAMFDGVVTELIGRGRDRQLDLTARNPLSRPLLSAVFFIRAFNRRNETVARWRVDLDRRVGVGQSVSVSVQVQTEPEWAIDDWEVVGAGAAEP